MSVVDRLVVVSVMGAVLVFRGRMDMSQRGRKHPDQERGTEYCHASSSHETSVPSKPGGFNKLRDIVLSEGPSLYFVQAAAVCTK